MGSSQVEIIECVTVTSGSSRPSESDQGKKLCEFLLVSFVQESKRKKMIQLEYCTHWPEI